MTRSERHDHRPGQRAAGRLSTPDGPRYATRKDFVYGEDVTIADWTIATDGLPLYRDSDTPQG